MNTFTNPENLQLKEKRFAVDWQKKLIFVEAYDNYSIFYFKDRKHPIVVSKTLKEIEKCLTFSSKFIRISRYIIINLDYLVDVKIVHKTGILVSEGKVMYISRRKIPFVKNAINDFLTHRI